jgi:hypothetical protein
MMARKVLLIGATGNFGKRLAHNLARIPGIALVVASRSLPKAAALAADITKAFPGFAVSPVALDRDRDLPKQLAGIEPWLVVDASGPFQHADYRVPLCALNTGAHFMDIADGRDYLSGFASALGKAATAKGLVALAGVSSTPALSSAVVAALTKDWRRIDTVDIAITPDGTGDVGAAAVEGVLSYAGQSIPQFRHGALTTVPGWMRSHVIDVPRLGKRRVAPVETIDAELFPAAFGVRSRVAFFAGLESPLEMGGLRVMAWLRAHRVLPSLKPVVAALVKARAITRLTSGLSGGMVVDVTGVDANGSWTASQWSLLAERGQGLNVPGLPIAAALRILLSGSFMPGARTVCGDIPLDAIEAEFRPLAISVSRRLQTLAQSPFGQILGADAMAQLPQAVADFHGVNGEPLSEGKADIDRGRNSVSRFVGWLLGLPPEGKNIPLRVSVERDAEGRERWTRNFAGKAFHSVMSRGRDGRMHEGFGPLTVILDLNVAEGKLMYPVRGAQIFGIPLPGFLLPSSNTFENADDQGRFRFDVRLGLPVSGLLAHYRGWLLPASPAKGRKCQAVPEDSR